MNATCPTPNATPRLAAPASSASAATAAKVPNEMAMTGASAIALA